MRDFGNLISFTKQGQCIRDVRRPKGYETLLI